MVDFSGGASVVNSKGVFDAWLDSEQTIEPEGSMPCYCGDPAVADAFGNSARK